MNEDGYSYPKEMVIKADKKMYTYSCEKCGVDIFPYYKCKVKGRIICRHCRQSLYLDGKEKPAKSYIKGYNAKDGARFKKARMIKDLFGKD